MNKKIENQDKIISFIEKNLYWLRDNLFINGKCRKIVMLGKFVAERKFFGVSK